MIYNRWRHFLVMFSLVISGVSHAGRDPFQPPKNIACLNVKPEIPLWQLRGIVGQQDDYRAWLISPQGSGKLWAKGQRPDEIWQLLQLDAFSITVASRQGCVSSLKMMLKENIYAKNKDDTRTGTAVAPVASLRQPERNVTGIR